MNTNIRRLGIFFLAAFTIILIGLTYWQVIDATAMASRSDNPRLRLHAAQVRRGRIYDRNGVVLADRTIDIHGFVHRTYVDPSLSPVIGYDSPRFGKSELEQSYNSYLSGADVGTSWQLELNQLEHKVGVGDDIHLTIDDGLQRKVAAILPNAPSAAIVADPRNGDILAMVSKPTFDANQVNDPVYWNGLLHDPSSPLINRPANGYYTPGSVFKIVTLGAALDAGAFTLNSSFNGVDATGPITVDGHTFPNTINNLSNCGGRAIFAPISLEEALVCSDNISFAEVGLRLGAHRFLDYTQKFGIGQQIPFDVPVSVSHAGTIPDRVALADTAFGQGSLYVTPLQMLLADEAMAGSGTIPQPILVKNVVGPDGTEVKRASSQTLFRPISSAAAADVRSAMTAVVQRGTGVLASLPGVAIAGKTGTAETNDGHQPHAWFVSLAPADHPRVAVVVLVEHGGEGAYAAAPLAKQILADSLAVVR